jgi:hypothetical protein
MDLGSYFVYAVALLLLVAVVIFVKAALFDRRPQKVGLIFALLSVPLFMIYYDDRWPFRDIYMRDLVGWLDNFQGADPNFNSDITPAALIAVLLLVHMTVFQRLAVRKRLQRIQDPIANFFAGATCATLVGGILVTAFSWGWIGSVIVATVFTLVYLGALALLAAIIEIFVEVARLMAVWLKRKVFMVATFITRIASWVSSLSGRLGLRSFVEKIRADTMEQESRFVTEQEDQDRRLFEAYMRDRAKRRRLMAKHGRELVEPEAEADAAPPAPMDAVEPQAERT